MKWTSTDVIQRRVFPASHQMKFRKIPNLKTFCGWMFSLPHVRLQSLKQFENSKLYQPRTAYTFNGIIYVYNMLVAVPFKFYMENMSYLPQHAMKLLMKQKTLFKTNFHHDLSLDARVRTHTHSFTFEFLIPEICFCDFCVSIYPEQRQQNEKIIITRPKKFFFAYLWIGKIRLNIFEV